jgi:hypothetical protein
VLLIAIFGAVMLIWLNALVYAYKTANPLIRSDNWDFLDLVVRPFATGQFNLGDLFVKRYPADHSQPLRRIILLLHYSLFDIDFRVEALIGTAVALVNVGLLWLIARASWVGGSRLLRLVGAIVFVAIAAVYLSLNATTVFTWSLVTLNYTSHFFILLFVLAGWAAYRRASALVWIGFFVLALIADVVADDTALVATVALSMAALLIGLRQSSLRKGAATAAVAIAALATYLVLYRLFAPPVLTNSGAGLVANVSTLASHWHEAWQWVAIPLVSSIIQQNHLLAWFGSGSDLAELAIAVVMLVFHLWFWWRAFRGPINLTSFAAIAMMLLFYGLSAGILLNRVPSFGTDYLWQPRYALIYQWNLVALLFMILAQLPVPMGIGFASARTSPRFRQLSLALAATVGIVLIGMQVPYSVSAWNAVKFQKTYQLQQAQQMGQLAQDPTAVPQDCLPILTVCNFTTERRTELMDFLVQHHLNLFSPAFEERNHIYPNGAADPNATPPPTPQPGASTAPAETPQPSEEAP